MRKTISSVAQLSRCGVGKIRPNGVGVACCRRMAEGRFESDESRPKRKSCKSVLIEKIWKSKHEGINNRCLIWKRTSLSNSYSHRWRVRWLNFFFLKNYKKYAFFLLTKVKLYDRICHVSWVLPNTKNKPCGCGGTGRRKGLKIPRWKHCTSSILVSRTICRYSSVGRATDL